jgi:hypothetical protein
VQFGIIFLHCFCCCLFGKVEHDLCTMFSNVFAVEGGHGKEAIKKTKLIYKKSVQISYMSKCEDGG